MKLHKQIAGVLISGVMASPLAFAHDDGWRGPDDRREMRGHHAGKGGPHHRGHGHAHGPHRPPHHDRVHMRGAGPKHNWYKGTVLPMPYRGGHYVVSDWHGHHLHAPPRGYHWIHVGDDYVLAAIATGVIMSVLLN